MDWPTSVAGEELAAVDDEIALLDEKGDLDQAVALLRESLPARIDACRRFEQAAAPQRVFASGFLYSGSGAVVDHLLDHDGVRQWTPIGEMGLLKFRGGIHHLTRRLERGDRRQATIDFYLHVTGRKKPAGKWAENWERTNRFGRSLMAVPEASGYHNACFQLVRDLLDHDGPADLALARVAAGVEDALAQAQAGLDADLLVVDQAVNAWRLHFARPLRPSTFVVVHRDPRDQMCDIRVNRIARRRPVMPVEEFVDQYLERRAAFDRGRAEAEDRGHQFVRVAFEDFVTEPDVRSRVVEELQVSGRHQGHVRFDPAVSARNIGCHRDLMSPHDRRVLDASLGEFYHPIAETPSIP